MTTCPLGSVSAGHGALGEQPAQHLVGGPAHGGHGGDAEPLVDLGAARVVDARHDVLDAERLARDARGEDVGVVTAARRRRTRRRRRSARPRRVSRSNPIPVTVLPSNERAEPAERGSVRVDDGDVVTRLARGSWPGCDPTRPQPMMTKCTSRRYTRRHGGPCLRMVRSARWRGIQCAAWRHSGRVVKRLLLGRAMRSDRLGETLLPKRLALPVFASDALSSVAYAPDEIFLMLGLAGGAFVVTHSWQIALAVVVVMVVVVASLPAERARLPLRRRRLRGGDGQPRPQGRPHRRQRPARRLRPDRRGVGVVGGAERRHRVPVAARARGRGRDRHSSSCSPR